MADVVQPEGNNNNKKKWLIGCGGCLVAVVLLFFVAAFVGIGCMKQLESTSNEAVQNIFGSKAPEGYTSFGIPVPDKKTGEKSTVVLMMNLAAQKMMIAVDTVVPESDAKILRGGDAKEIETFIKRFASSDLKAASAKSGSSIDVKNIRMEGMRQVKLDNGKTFPALDIRIINEGEYSPGVAGFIVKPGNRLTMLFAMDPGTSSTEPEQDFKANYDTLAGDVTQLVNDTALDDQLAN